VLYYRRGEYARSAADCEKVLRLNPVHFAAASGMGQCYLRMKKPKAALRAFRTALSINPDLESVREAVSALKAAFGDD
jgi:tetratricopeptide (TPR) repeat protein